MKRSTSLALLLVTLGVQGTSSQSLLETPPTWGQSVDGLRMGIAGGRRVPSSGGEFTLALQNTGSRDFVVNLGLMLANGKEMFPTAVRLPCQGGSLPCPQLHGDPVAFIRSEE